MAPAFFGTADEFLAQLRKHTPSTECCSICLEDWEHDANDQGTPTGDMDGKGDQKTESSKRADVTTAAEGINGDKGLEVHCQAERSDKHTNEDQRRGDDNPDNDNASNGTNRDGRLRHGMFDGYRMSSGDDDTVGQNQSEVNNPSGKEDATEGADHAILTPCGHQFHKMCLGTWLKDDEATNHNRCPFCRARLVIGPGDAFTREDHARVIELLEPLRSETIRWAIYYAREYLRISREGNEHGLTWSDALDDAYHHRRATSRGAEQVAILIAEDYVKWLAARTMVRVIEREGEEGENCEYLHNYLRRFLAPEDGEQDQRAPA